MARLTQKQVLMGINRSRVMGRHKLEKNGNVNVVGSNVKAPDLNKKGQRLDTERDLEVKKGAELDLKRTAENEFMASSSDMRGKQTSKTFRGARVYDWSPTRDFRPDAVGDVRDGGAFTGGFINEANQRARKGYAVPQGHIKKGVGHGGEGINNVNPFSINLRVKPKDLRRKK